MLVSAAKYAGILLVCFIFIFHYYFQVNSKFHQYFIAKKSEKSVVDKVYIGRLSQKCEIIISKKSKKGEQASETRSQFMARMKSRMAKRKQLVKEKCANLDIHSQSKSPMRFFLSHAYKFLFCCIPKTGVTNWKKIFLRLNGINTNFSKISRSQIHRSAAPFSKDCLKLPEDTESYLKMMVVRHPISRLVSAYNDKLTRRDDGIVRWGSTSRAIRKLFKHDTRNNGLATYDDFAKYFVLESSDKITKVKSNLEKERHWMTYYSLCDPCNIEYDVIGHLETIEEDSRFVLELLNVSHIMSYDVGYDSSGSSQTNLKTVNQITEKLKPSLMQKVREKLKVDFDLFGYFFTC